MKRIIPVLLILSCTVFTLPAYPQETTERKGIAVLDFKPSGVSASEASFVTDFLRNAIVASKVFRLIDKSNMDKILAEQGFQQTGCTTQECAVQMGKLLNVQGMLSGTFGMLFGEYVMTVNLVNVETGEIIFSDTGRCKNPGQLQSLAAEVANRLAADQTGKVLPVKSAAPAAPIAAPPSVTPPTARAYTPTPPVTPRVTTAMAGKIIKIQGSQITINLGSLHGLKKNKELAIMAVVQEIKSPITGQVIKRKTKAIGKVKITYVEAQASMGILKALKPGYSIQKGMLVQRSALPKIKLTSRMTMMFSPKNDYTGPDPAPDNGGPFLLADSFTNAEFNFPNLRIYTGVIYLRGRLPASINNVLPYLLASYNSDSFEIGLGISPYDEPGVSGIFRIGSETDKGLNFSGKIFAGSEYNDSSYYGGGDPSPDIEDNTIIVGLIEANLVFSSSFKLFLKSDFYDGSKFYGGHNMETPPFYDNNIGIDLYAYRMEETRAASLLGVSFNFSDSLTLSLGGGSVMYKGIQTLEYDLLDDDNWTIVEEEPREFNTGLLSSRAMLQITDSIGIGIDYEVEFNTDSEDYSEEGRSPAHSFVGRIEMKF